MYRLDAKEWTEPERQAIAVFTKTFTPAWTLPSGQFSDMVEPTPEYYIGGPDVVLDEALKRVSGALRQ